MLVICSFILFVYRHIIWPLIRYGSCSCMMCTKFRIRARKIIFLFAKYALVVVVVVKGHANEFLSCCYRPVT